ncbi:MAG: flagellar basal body P-ring formation chaperone FlgA, partial [Bdellovibrionota bacterium]
KSRCAIDKKSCCRWSMAGQRTASFRHAEVSAEMAKMKFAGLELSLKAEPREVEVIQTRRELTQEEIEKKVIEGVSAKLGENAKNISVETLRAINPVFIALDDEKSWDVLLPENITHQISIKIVSTHAKTEVLGWVQAMMRVNSEVYVAKNTVRPTELINAAQFELKKVNVLTLPTNQAVLAKQPFPSGIRAQQTILAGSPLLSTAVERIPLVRLGDAVTLILRSDALQISTKGIVQGPAGIGDMVTVQLPRYGRTFRGRLIEGKLVEVWL